ncbi:MAG: hypothetical protein GXO27_07480 [Chlorobi bacterium]|nr:hypothetical protein [Chlorobiota bacterium]
MKKLLTGLALLSVWTLMHAQRYEVFRQAGHEAESSGTLVLEFSPYSRGDVAIEVEFNPQKIFASDSGAIFGLVNNTFKYRMFKKKGRAVRLGFYVGFTHRDDIIQQENSGEGQKELHERFTGFGLAFMPGFERHYAAGKRVSPYTGFVMMVAYSQNQLEVESQDGGSVSSVILVNRPDLPYAGALAVGAGFVTGVDYFVAKHLYLGVELGLGGQYTRYLPVQVKGSGVTESVEFDRGFEITLAPALTTAAFRLGWVF